MGILNVTPDSFSDGGRYMEVRTAVQRGMELESLGADILDIGGESSRPGSTAVSQDEELRRVVPVIDALARQLKIPISVDTYRAEVARRALDAGAQVINDISAFRFDEDLASVACEYKAGVILMHSRGRRDELHRQPPMQDAVSQVTSDLRSSVQFALQAGVVKQSVVIDPGIGFGKRAEESLAVLRNLEALVPLECPVLIGTSRKSFIRKIAGITDDRPYDARWGTAATVAAAVMKGAHIVRVHDVQETRTLVDVLDAIME
jgi:dihydropteroate synthase